MSTNRNLLKEAIADAKTVKETAIANAKAVLEESFAPQLKSMISLKLQEMADEYDEYEEDEMTDDELLSMEEASNKDMDLGEEMDLDDLLKELNEEEEEEESEEEEEESEEGEPVNLEDMTDEDLKNMIEDVIKDMIKSGELEAGEGEEETEDEMEDEMEDEEVNLEELLREIESLEEKDEMYENDEEMMYEEEIDEITLNPYKRFVNKFISKNQSLADQAKSDEEAYNKLYTLFQNYMKDNGISGGARNEYIGPFNAMFGKKGEGAYKGGKFSATGAGELSGGQVSELQNKLDEAYSTIETLRRDLNEVNLLNAKLLYTNKIFKSKNLNENQKVKVLSSFDKATTVNEVKLVFETLNEGLKVKTTKLNENLGSASKVLGTPKKQPIVESNDMVARFQKLAGII
jgi:hypothetical protein